jgi:hypothetical protein
MRSTLAWHALRKTRVNGVEIPMYEGDTKMRINALALVAFALLGGVARGKECSNAILNGSYGINGSGTIIGVGPVGLVGVLKYDGLSTFTGTIVQRTNGNIVQFTVTGTYMVDSNCIVTDVSSTSTGQTASHTYVVVDNGHEFYSINMVPSPANVIIATAKRQFRGSGNTDDR